MESTSKAVEKTEESQEKLELNRDDLIKLLSCLEGKLQGSEIAIAALKNDRLKRLFYPPAVKRPLTKNKKLNRNSMNYATIIPSSKGRDREETNLNENLETVLNTNLDDLDKSPEKLDTILDDFTKELEDNYDVKNSLFPNNKYNEYRRTLETNPYLALASDLQYAYDTESHESLITKVYNSRVLRVKQLIKEQQEARKFLEEQLDELSTRYKNVVDELEIEKDKNIRFHRDEIVKKLEKTEQEKKELETELNNLKKEYETEKEREKVMIIYLLSERKQLIIRLIEESGKNTELVNLLSGEKNRSAEMEEGLEEESKRSLQMEIDLECLANKYETEKNQLEERLRNFEKRNQELESECDKLKQKLSELNSSNNTNNNNNSITSNKNLTDLGEGVRSTIVTFNNAIAANSTVVSRTLNRQMPNVVQSLQTKPILAAKPSFDSMNANPATNGNKSTVTIINTQPVRSNCVQSKPSFINKANSTTNSTIDTTTSSTSVASVIQKFSNNSISNNTTPPVQNLPLVKKLSSSGLVANIAQNIVSQASNTAIRAAPPVPQKPQVKERTAKMLEQQNSSKDISVDVIKHEIDLIKQINSNLDELSKTSLFDACSKNIQKFDEKLDIPKVETICENIETIPDSKLDDCSNSIKKSNELVDRRILSRLSNQKKFVRTNAMRSQGSK